MKNPEGDQRLSEVVGEVEDAHNKHRKSPLGGTGRASSKDKEIEYLLEFLRLLTQPGDSIIRGDVHRRLRKLLNI